MYSYFYNFTLTLYEVGLNLAAFFHPKAKLWVKGRKEQEKKLADYTVPTGKKIIWIHCASLGEFEQGRPVIELLKKKQEHIFIVLTFFSPSGYEIRKDYEKADLVLYLPLDKPKKVAQFIAKIKPQIALFVKYEIWPNYYKELSKKGIPILLISAIFRENQRFFKGFAKQWFQKSLNHVAHFFVQNKTSEELLNAIGITQVTTCGDTRFDRVVTIAQQSKSVKEIHGFFTGEPIVILGSSWPADEQLIINYMKSSKLSFKIIVAPHEIHPSRIKKLHDKFNRKATTTFSSINQEDLAQRRVLIIDNMGMLMRLYSHADIAIIGGGYGKGIHNTLEAATFGLPILFGPNYQKFEEAKELINRQAAFVVTRQTDFDHLMTKLLEDVSFRTAAGEKAKEYVVSQLGATQTIVNHLQGYLEDK